MQNHARFGILPLLANTSRALQGRMQRTLGGNGVCTECLAILRYVRKKVKAKTNVDEATKAKRQAPSSHFPWKFLSPGSKIKRARNSRQQRSRLNKQVLRFYKRTKIELPGQQSKELCQLIEAIENSETGKTELHKITADGNKHEGKGGLKAGDCINEVWKKDRESFFNDQRNNGMRELNCIYVYILSNNMLNLLVNKVLVGSPLMGFCTCCLNPTYCISWNITEQLFVFSCTKKVQREQKVGNESNPGVTHGNA